MSNQIGLETVHDCQGWATGDNCGLCYICQMRAVMREVWRVLRDDGTCWVNLGDSYAASGARTNNNGEGSSTMGWPGQRKETLNKAAKMKLPPMDSGLKPKDLCMIPARFALAVQSDGWYLRSDIIWAKPNPMPESVTDRPTKAHEYLFLLAKSPRYYYDADAVRERIAQSTANDSRLYLEGYKAPIPERGYPGTRRSHGSGLLQPNPAGRNRRTVWNIATQPTPFAHFATFPEKLVEPMIKAGTSERGVCAECGASRRRVVRRTPNYTKRQDRGQPEWKGPQVDSSGWSKPTVEKLGWTSTCNCNADTRPAIVLDPFAGSGTTGIVARKLGRRFVGLDLSFEYLQTIARRRLGLTALDQWNNGAEPSELNTTGLPLFEEVS